VAGDLGVDPEVIQRAREDGHDDNRRVIPLNAVTTCDIYLRLSDARIEEAFEGRETKLRAFADTLGWTVHRVVVENDVYPDGRVKPASAWRRRKIKTPSGGVELRTVRPGFRSMVDDIVTGRVNGLLAEDLDRVLRQPRDGEDLLDAVEQKRANVRSLSGSLKLTDGGTSDERFTARILAAAATKSSEDTARRVRDSRERWFGKSYQGGPRPYGFVHAQDTEQYQRTLLIVDDEADVIRKAADDILNKDISLRSIARDLRERGVPDAHGRCKWTSESLKNILTKPAVAGLMTHKGELKEAPWDAILDRDIWEQLCASLNDPSRRLDHANEPKYLLSGIAQCGICSNGETVRVTGGKKHYLKPSYVCRAHDHLKRQALATDAWVERNVTAYLSRHGVDIEKPEPRPDINRDALRAEQKKLRSRKETQIRMHALGEIEDADLAVGLRVIRDRLNVIEAQLAQSDQPDPIPEFRRHGPTRRIWASLPLTRKRAILRKLVTVTILPTARKFGRAGGLDCDSVRIVVRETGDVLDVREWPAEMPVFADR
jgi:site-specific DNA recombinase